MLLDGEGFFSCGAGEASRVELAVPGLEVLTLPMFTSETEAESSFAPSIWPSVGFVSCGEVFAEPNYRNN
jgi:hypothetical protein